MPATRSLSATFSQTEVVKRVRSDGLALRGPSIRPDSYRPVATLDERDRLSMSGSPTHPAKWRGRRHRDQAGECVVRSPSRDKVSVAELVGFVFRGDGGDVVLRAVVVQREPERYAPQQPELDRNESQRGLDEAD